MEYHMKPVGSCDNKYEECLAGKVSEGSGVAIYENVTGASKPTQVKSQVRCSSFTPGEHVYEDLKPSKRAKKENFKR